jgi:cobalt-zinc-cadmium resistance protein CzcA
MKMYLIILLSCFSIVGFSQNEKLSVGQTIDMALKNNEGIRAASYEIEYQKQLKKTSFDLPKTEVSYLRGQYNSYDKRDNNLTISQAIPIAALGSQGTLNRSLVVSSELKKTAAENQLVYEVKQVYYQLSYLYSLRTVLSQQDSLYESFLKGSSLRYKTGETNLLEQTTAEMQRNEMKNQLFQNDAAIMILRTRLKTLLNSQTLPEIEETTLREIEFTAAPDSAAIASNPSLAFQRQQIEVARGHKKVESAKFGPDILVGFFSQTLIGAINPENGSIASRSQRFNGFQLGVAIPLWFVAHQGRVKAAEFNQQAAQSNYRYQQIMLAGEMDQALQQFTNNKTSLEYYRTSALPNSTLILHQSETAFRGGEIGYAEYLSGVRSAIGIKQKYLQALNDYDQSVLYLEFLSGNK